MTRYGGAMEGAGCRISLMELELYHGDGYQHSGKSNKTRGKGEKVIRRGKLSTVQLQRSPSRNQQQADPNHHITAIDVT